jgi:hypothetical protein
MTHINEMKDNIFVIILGVMLASTALTTLTIESHADRRQLPHGTYTAIGKLLACSDVKATTVIGILIREGLGCGFTGGIALSADVNNSLHILTREAFMNHTSSTESLNYTALGESLTCQDINRTSANAPTLINLLGCQNINNGNSSTVP